jgi:hypothetical protein
MIIFCMNSTSFGERGGSDALVVGGKMRVGFPGAPGCTITGGAVESACCAQTGSDKKQVKATAAIIPPRRAAKTIIDRGLNPALKGDDCVGVEWSSIERLIYHKLRARRYPLEQRLSSAAGVAALIA